jgi:spore germination protein GerM
VIPRHLKIGIVVMLVAVLGLTAYLWQFKRRATRLPIAPDSAHVAPPATGPSEQVTLYVAYDSPPALYARAGTIPLSSGRQERAESVLRALLAAYTEPDSTHPLPAGSEVRSVFLVDPGLAVVDLNSTLANGHRSGILTEELTVTSIVQTLAADVPGITRVKILVDGQERETLAGHADLTAFFDVGNVQRMVEEMKPPQ